MTRLLSTPAKKNLVINALDDIKARDILAIDVRKVTYAFDWIVVATAESARQTKALARHVADKLREKGAHIIGIEGEESGDWILVDAGDIVAHIMQPAIRTYYNLEDLWGEGKSDSVLNPTVPVSLDLPSFVPEPKARSARKAAPKKATVKKAAAKKPAVKKPVTKKKAAAKKPAPKPAPVKRRTRKAAR
jgi:ribosome-associated protein